MTWSDRVGPHNASDMVEALEARAVEADVAAPVGRFRAAAFRAAAGLVNEIGSTVHVVLAGHEGDDAGQHVQVTVARMPDDQALPLRDPAVVVDGPESVSAGQEPGGAVVQLADGHTATAEAIPGHIDNGDGSFTAPADGVAKEPVEPEAPLVGESDTDAKPVKVDVEKSS